MPNESAYVLHNRRGKSAGSWHGQRRRFERTRRLHRCLDRGFGSDSCGRAIHVFDGLPVTRNRLAMTTIAANDPHPRKRVPVLDSEMSYVDVGSGDPIVFLHGNADSSYLWRNVIPHVADCGRCLAPDYIGMGRSSPSPTEAYRFPDQSRYLDAWFDALGLTKNVILVMEDWGTSLGFYRGARFPSHIQALAHMEGMPVQARSEDFGARLAAFTELRTERGQAMILDDNYYIEVQLQKGIMRSLSQDEMAVYRAPYLNPRSRLPMFSFRSSFPLDGEPADVAAAFDVYGAWLARSPIPKLLITADPGQTAKRVLDVARTWPNSREVRVKGIHRLPEDSPHDIGRALREFIEDVRSLRQL
jgi:haloalkane dehalogenase